MSNKKVIFLIQSKSVILTLKMGFYLVLLKIIQNYKADHNEILNSLLLG